MERVMIIGPAGSGKSTLAEKLGEILSIPHYHMDCLKFKAGWQEVADEDLYAEHEKIIDSATWVLDGNYRNGTNLKKRMELADTVIMIDFSTMASLYNVIRRRIIYHNRTRPSLPNGCEEKLDLEFIRWVLETGKRRPCYYRILEDMKTMNKSVLVFKTRRQVNTFLKELRATSK